MLSVARRIVEADKFTRSGKFKGWEPELMLGSDIFGKTLGVIGAGRIGQAVMKRAIGFGMRVIYYSKSRLPLDIESNLNASYVSLEKLLKEADFVSLHVPLTKNTYRSAFFDEANSVFDKHRAWPCCRRGGSRQISKRKENSRGGS